MPTPRSTVKPSTPPGNFRVITVKPLDKGNIKALIDIEFIDAGLTIRDWKIVQQPGQRPWVSAPTREWQDGDGRRRYTPMVELDGKIMALIDAAILHAYEVATTLEGMDDEA